MTPERWQQVTAVFHAARVHDASARGRYLDQACANDAALRAEVEAMLAAHGESADRGSMSVNVPTSSMPQLESGMTFGSYRIERLIGAGGMGEVYRARDTKLGREVAVKVLPATFTSDPERLARFDREARALAALNHPHIAAIYGFDEAHGRPALILELVDGDTLADRIARGPIPIGESILIARQIAEALEAAHERSIIHRDLKPANIKITPAGVVKILDFGLAKAFAGNGSGGDLSISTVGTREGVIAGTPAYMSPEQARGQLVDKRTDIWAFGCVLYEMLTGHAAFRRESLSDTLAAVLESSPDWQRVPATTPPNIRRVLQRCLEKDPKRRIHDIADGRIDIDEISAAAPGDGASAASLTTPRSSRAWRTRAAWAAVVLIAGSIAATATWVATSRAVPLRVSRFTITPPSTAPIAVIGVERDIAITPDGRHIVYVGANGSALFIRALDQLETTRLDGLGMPHGPFVSSDGRWIGFVDGQGTLKTVALTGGAAIVLGRLESLGSSGATWGPDDTIVFATSSTATGLQRIPAAGGEPTVLTRPNRTAGELDHQWPEFLPGGEAVLFTIHATTGGIAASSVALLDLRSGQGADSADARVGGPAGARGITPRVATRVQLPTSVARRQSHCRVEHRRTERHLAVGSGAGDAHAHHV